MLRAGDAELAQRPVRGSMSPVPVADRSAPVAGTIRSRSRPPSCITWSSRTPGAAVAITVSATVKGRASTAGSTAC